MRSELQDKLRSMKNQTMEAHRRHESEYASTPNQRMVVVNYLESLKPYRRTSIEVDMPAIKEARTASSQA